MNYKPSFTEINSNEIQSWVNYGNPGETTKTNPNSLKIRVRVFFLHYFCPTRVNHVSTEVKPSPQPRYRFPSLQTIYPAWLPPWLRFLE